MKIEEFKKYLNITISNETGRMINSQSIHGISELRNKICIYAARVGQEVAITKNKIREEFLLTKSNAKEKISDKLAREMAEQKIDSAQEVSRRELEYLERAMRDLANSCASRVNILLKELT